MRFPMVRISEHSGPRRPKAPPVGLQIAVPSAPPFPETHSKERLATTRVKTGQPQDTVKYFVNAHSLNAATSDRAYRKVLNSGDIVFGDGTGVRWAARLRGIRLRDNVNGTDLVPALLTATAGREYRCFLLGTDEDSIRRAADHATAAFPGWTLAGYHHGYLTTPTLNARAVDRINRARTVRRQDRSGG